jgi:predicted dienelactone hydrolase
VAAGTGGSRPERRPPAPIWVRDERIKAAVVAAPAPGYAFTAGGVAGVKAPVQLWKAEDDPRAPNRWNGDIVEASLPSPPEAHLVQAADHFAFLAPCSEALSRIVPEFCAEVPGFDRTAFHRDFNAAVVASASSWKADRTGGGRP